MSHTHPALEAVDKALLGIGPNDTRAAHRRLYAAGLWPPYTLPRKHLVERVCPACGGGGFTGHGTGYDDVCSDCGGTPRGFEASNLPEDIATFRAFAALGANVVPRIESIAQRASDLWRHQVALDATYFVDPFTGASTGVPTVEIHWHGLRASDIEAARVANLRRFGRAEDRLDYTLAVRTLPPRRPETLLTDPPSALCGIAYDLARHGLYLDTLCPTSVTVLYPLCA